MSAIDGYIGREFAVGPNGFKTVVVAEDRHNAGLMLEVAAGIPGFAADLVPDEAAVEGLGRCAREIRDWAERYSDEHGPVPHTWYYDEELAQAYMAQALSVGKTAVRIQASRIGDEYPNAGSFYQRYYALQDAARQPEN